MSTYNASDFGTDGAAIQAAINAAVVEMRDGLSRWATVYVPRVPGVREWKLDAPLELGPVGGINLVGDGMGSFAESWSGTKLDATALPADTPAIHVHHGAGMALRDFNIVLGQGDGVRFNSNARASQVTRRLLLQSVSIGGADARSTALRFESDAGTNQQCGSEVVMLGCQLEAGRGLYVNSAQCTNLSMIGGLIRGHRVGVTLKLGFLHFWQTAFNSSPGSTAAIIQYGGQSHLTVRDCYAEVGFGDFLVGVGTHHRPTLLSGTRIYMQDHAGYWVNAPGFKNLRIDDACTFEQDPEGAGLVEVHPEAKEEAVRLGPGSAPLHPTEPAHERARAVR